MKATNTYLKANPKPNTLLAVYAVLVTFITTAYSLIVIANEVV